MPAAGSPQLPKEGFYGFLGIDLKHDGLSVADHDVLRAINADLHAQLGTIRLRAGRTSLGDTGSGIAIRTIDRHNTRRYQVSGTVLYRDFTSALTGLDGTTLVTTLTPYQPLNDTTTWSFIADRAFMKKDDGTTIRQWGITPPSAAPTLAAGAAGVLTGVYNARYTYARIVAGAVAHESNPCPLPTAVTLAAQKLDIPVVASTDAQVTNIRIYRTLTGGSAFFFDQQVANSTTTITSSQADTGLGTSLETDNDVPPNAAWCSEFQGHIFLCNTGDDRLWYSKQYRPESVGSSQYLKIGDSADPLQSMVPLTGVLGVFSRLSKYRVFGNSVSGFAYLEALNSRGIVSPQALLASSRGALFVARDGLWLTNFVEADVEIGQALQPLFYGQTVNAYTPIDWAQTAAMSLAEWKRRLYFGYQDTAGARMLAVYSYDTQHWYHYQHSVNRLFYEEVNDFLLMGDTTGQVWKLENGVNDNGSNIALSVDIPPRAGGDRFVRKGYEWIGVDAAGSAVWNIQVLMDGANVTTVGVSGSRQKRYVRLPEQTTGRQWQVKATYTGQDQAAALYGVEVIETTHTQGQVWVEDPSNSSLFLEILPGVQPTLPLVHRRFTFAKLDADALETSTATGVWAGDLYVDGLLRATIEFSRTLNRYFHALPAELMGYEHYWRVRYNGTTVPLLYSLQAVDTGVEDGQVWVAVPGVVDAYHTILPVRQQVDATRRKRFLYMRLDAEAASGTWALGLYIDGSLRYTMAVTGNRNRTLLRLPPNLFGYTWRVRAEYSLNTVPTLYSVDVLTQELKPA